MTIKETDKPSTLRIESGIPLPLGVHRRQGGLNFSLFSRHAGRVWLELFDGSQGLTLFSPIELLPSKHRTGDIRRIWIGDLTYEQLYLFRVEGPYQPEQGHRFNQNRLLLDPYATALVGTDCWDFSRARGFDSTSLRKDLSFSTEDNRQWVAKCLATGAPFDWQGHRPLKYPWSKTIIYETHIRGLTIHPSSGTKNRGTFLGLIEKIPYLRKLGITAVELMPVQEFNENELRRTDPSSGERLKNYWGYDTISYFAPKESYASGRRSGCQVIEFKEMVKELHKAKIEIILDVVLNHTAEGNESGPTLSFRGIDNKIFYILEDNPRFYKNYSGCGNTLNCNHPILRDYILDCLRYWVIEMHVDGFRFDLASILGRDEDGKLLRNPPLLERIAEDPILHDVKLIAEAWDAGGAYQVGSFPGQRWSEWNGRYRDDVRRFWRGDTGMTGALATRICGSSDLYQRVGKAPLNSINFITCHDGFTLNDLVSYKNKHNEANGEENRDGSDKNYSDNYGAEGESSDPVIRELRIRQMKNMLATLFVSRGVPMLLGGDEFGRTQHGNNNAYCEDNEISWYNWEYLERNHDLFRFARELIAFRKRHPVLREEKFYTDRQIHWFNEEGGNPDWNGLGRTLGCLIVPEQAEAPTGNHILCLLFNTDTTEKEFNLPPIPQDMGKWHLALDTALTSPEDILEQGREKPLEDQKRYVLKGKSMVIVVS